MYKRQTQDYGDAWFVGFTAKLVTAVWVGNDDNSKMKRVTGAGLPGEIWGKYMKAAHAGAQPIPLPGGLWPVSYTHLDVYKRQAIPHPAKETCKACSQIQRLSLIHI